MGRLIYSAIQSLDAYTVDAAGDFDWSAPSEQVHAFVNDLESPVGTYLYGRRMYEVMRSWESVDAVAEPSAVMREYAALWQAADKVVFSSTLEAVSTRRTRLEPRLTPDRLRELKQAADADLSVGGGHVAADAVRAGLVDVFRLFVTPTIVGGGTPFLPVGARLALTLTAQQRFDDGVMFLEYQPR